jgi:lipopolysaccharide transport system ATP-binding protein
MSEIAIRVRDLGKCYQIYDMPRDRLKQFVVPRLWRAMRPLRRLLPSGAAAAPVFYREFWALRDVSFDLAKGETVGIIGRNGSGKSTLLQLICGTLSPTTGSVEASGRIAALLELGAGFNPEFTGRENVLMNAAILGLGRQEIDARFDDIAAFADIGPFIEQPVKTYSSGMYLRLAFAVNIMSSPEIMVVDEALAVGDMAFQAKCMTALTRMQDAGATVLFVSHDIGALKSLCSRGICLERGSVLEIGPAGMVAEHYNRRVREEMNAVLAPPAPGAVESATGASDPTSALTSDDSGFRVSPEFESRIAQFRYGDGGARVTFAELLDENCQPIDEAGFDQSVTIRVCLEAWVDSAKISINYYILDEKKNFILGSDVLLAGGGYIRTARGGRYVVTYRTRLPLHEGSHSLHLEVTETIGDEVSARFLDVIDDAIIFRMRRREGVRLWAKAYVANEVEIRTAPPSPNANPSQITPTLA